MTNNHQTRLLILLTNDSAFSLQNLTYFWKRMVNDIESTKENPRLIATQRDSRPLSEERLCSLSRSVATIEEVRFASPGIPDSPLNRDHPHELSSRSISSFIYPI